MGKGCPEGGQDTHLGFGLEMGKSVTTWYIVYFAAVLTKNVVEHWNFD
jgi:hypothetical protein